MTYSMGVVKSMIAGTGMEKPSPAARTARGNLEVKSCVSLSGSTVVVRETSSTSILPLLTMV